MTTKMEHRVCDAPFFRIGVLQGGGDLLQTQLQPAEGLILSQNVADLHSAAGGDCLAGGGDAHRPHEGGVLDAQGLGQGHQGVVDSVIGPVRDGLQGGDGGLQHMLGDLGVGLGLLVGEEVGLILGQDVEEVQLHGDIGELLAPGLEEGGDLPGGVGLVLHGLTDIGLRHGVEVLGRELPEVVGVEVGELFDVEDGGGLGDALDVEDVGELLHGEELPFHVFAPGRPAQEGHVVDHRLGEVAHGQQVLIGGVPLPLGHLVVLVPHDGGAVDIGGHVPAEALVEQVVLGGGGEVLAAPDHVGDAHEVVVDDVGEVVGGQAVPLEEDLVVQGAVLHGDVAKDGVVEGGLALLGDLLADDVRHAGVHLGLGLLGGEGAAGVVGPVELAAVGLGLGLFAEAVIGVAQIYQALCVFAVKVPALGLDIGAHGAAHVGALVPGEAALAQGVVDDLGGPLHQPPLIGVLDAQDELAAAVAGNEPGVQGGAQIAHMHVAGGGGGETGADLPVGDAGFHVVEPLFVQSEFLQNVHVTPL